VENLLGYSPYRDLPQIDRPVVGIMATPTWTNVRKDVSPKLLEFLPESAIRKDSRFRPNGYPQSGGWPLGQISLTNGSSLLFRPMEGKQVNKSGFGADFVGINEPPDEVTYNEMVRALGASHEAWGELTINACMVGRDCQWLQDIVEGDPIRDIAPQPGWDQIVIELDSENCHWLSEQQIQAQKDRYLGFEADQRVKGAWRGKAAGAWIGKFSAGNICSSIPYDVYTIVVDVDWGDGPNQSVGLELVSSSHIISLDEWNGKPDVLADIPEIAGFIREMLARNQIALGDVDEVWGDTNKVQIGRSDKMNDQLGLELGLRVRNAEKGAGQDLYFARLLNAACGRGKYQVTGRCPVLQRALRQWAGKEDEHKHSMDRLRYGTLRHLERLFHPAELMYFRVI